MDDCNHVFLTYRVPGYKISAGMSLMISLCRFCGESEVAVNRGRELDGYINALKENKRQLKELQQALLVAAKEMTDCQHDIGDMCPLEIPGVCARKMDASKCPYEEEGHTPTISEVWDCWQIRWKSMAAFDEAVADLQKGE